MRLRDVITRSLRFRWRSHLGVLLGATLAAAVLIGALVVGDSVRGTLRDRALAGTAGYTHALDAHDRFFRTDLSTRQDPANVVRETTILSLAGTISRQDGAARANRVTVRGVAPGDFGIRTIAGAPSEWVWLSEPLARQLGAKPGDEFIIRLQKPSALSRDAVITPKDDASVAIRLQYGGVIQSEFGGGLNLQSGSREALNVFIDRERLAGAVGLAGRSNLRLLDVEASEVRGWRPLSEWLLSMAGGVSARGAAGGGVLFHRLATRPIPGTAVAELLQSRLRWDLDDAELTLETKGTDGAPVLSLTSRRIFIDHPVEAVATRPLKDWIDVTGTNAASLAVSGVDVGELGRSITGTTLAPILTYLVNGISNERGLAPYSMVTAAGAPWTPADLGDDEIVVNEWLAGDLGLKVGDMVWVSYYRADSAASLVERTNQFRVRSVVPMGGVHADRTLMPEFPGLAKAESTHDWDAGFDLVHKIRDKDEAYWKERRGTPKAFVNLKVGQAMWSNRFGNLTAVKWLVPAGTGPAELRALKGAMEAGLRRHLKPEDIGLRYEPIRDRALAGAEGGQDFGGLFIGFSFFLIVSALLLTSLLFRFGIEQRGAELGVLLATGWRPARVLRAFLGEGMALATVGAIAGTLLGTLYGRAVLHGLNTIWADAVAGAGLKYHATLATLLGGAVGSVAVAGFSMWLALRSAARRPARELLNEGFVERAVAAPGGTFRRWIPWVTTALAVALVAAGFGVPEAQRAGLFFGAGAVSLIAGLTWVRVWLRVQLSRAGGGRVRRDSLATRASARKPARSMATVSLLASATFLIVAVGANKLDANRDAQQRSSGTGGFLYWAESALPVVPDLNTVRGRERVGLDTKLLEAAQVRVVGMRVRDGDEASCLNLNQAQRPRLLGVDPQALAGRGAFTFHSLLKGVTVTNGWLALSSSTAVGAFEEGVPVVPAVGDANSIQWALKRKLGDTLDYTDERGQPFRVKLVGAVANSILQGNLLIDETEFARRFPSESGRRVFLIDATRANPPVGSATDPVAAELSRGLQDNGLELMNTSERLNRFNGVQNTYLNTFQVLGALGLLLGSFGLGVVVLRNVFERRGELAVMQAVGFEPAVLRRFILVEHAVLLLLGLGVGIVASVLVVLPSVVAPGGGGIPWPGLAGMLGGVLVNGLLWTWLATRRAMHGTLLGALRGE